MVSASERRDLKLRQAPGAAPRVERDAMVRMAQMIAFEGYTYGQALGVSEEYMQALYTCGYDLQKRGQFQQAMRIFQYLCYLNHYEESYWIALGFSREKLKKWPDALQAYVMAGMLSDDNPIPALRTAECMLQMGNLSGAKKAANMALKLAGDDPRYEQRRRRAEFLLKVIDKRQQRQSTRKQSS